MPAVHRELAPAKLTRSLAVTGVREDGFHLIESEMVTVDLLDELELVEPDAAARDGAPSDLVVIEEVEWSGCVAGPGASPVAVPADGSNLVLRALAALGRSAQVRLVKRIPAGAGLGGGSADAAAVLRWAGVSDVSLAARLGSDVPFCVRGGRALARGVGELLEMLPFEDLWFVLVTPRLGVSTPAVYRKWDELGGPSGYGPNDLELAAIEVEPRLDWWRSFLGGVVGRPPTLAGSGSTWFVECDSSAAAGQLAGVLAQAVAEAATDAMVVAACSVRGGPSDGQPGTRRHGGRET